VDRGIFSLKTFEERNNEVRSPKFPNTVMILPEELKLRVMNLGPLFNCVRLKYKLELSIWGLPRSYPKIYILFWITEDHFLGSQLHPLTLENSHE